MKTLSNKGIAYIYVILAILIMVEIIQIFFVFKKNALYRMSYQARSNIALYAAEAGIAIAMNEVQANVEFRTHNVTGSVGNSTWGTANSYSLLSKGIGKLTINGGNGTISGAIGSFGQWKVKLRQELTNDNMQTGEMKEDNMFLRVEAVGKCGEIQKKLSCLVQIDELNKYAWYDGDYVNTVMGWKGKATLSRGYIYGKNAVLMWNAGGVKTIYDKVPMISTGQNGYLIPKVWDTNTYLKNETYSSGDGKKLTMAEHGTRYAELNSTDEDTQTINTEGGVLKDKSTGALDRELKYDVGEMILAKARDRGIIITSGSESGSSTVSATLSNYFNGSGSNFQAKIIDFGLMRVKDDAASDDCKLRSDDSAVFLPKETRTTAELLSEDDFDAYPSDFNGIIWADCNLVLRGNPDRCLTIYSEGFIFMDGDFNQRAFPEEEKISIGGSDYGAEYDIKEVFQNFTDEVQLEYTPITIGSKLNTYDVHNRTYYDTTGSPSGSPKRQGLFWQYCDIIAGKVLWKDYRNPLTSFKNELLPLIEYELTMEVLREIDKDGLVNSASSDNKIKTYAYSLALSSDKYENDLRCVNPNEFGTGSEFPAQQDIGKTLLAALSGYPNVGTSDNTGVTTEEDEEPSEQFVLKKEHCEKLVEYLKNNLGLDGDYDPANSSTHTTEVGKAVLAIKKTFSWNDDIETWADSEQSGVDSVTSLGNVKWTARERRFIANYCWYLLEEKIRPASANGIYDFSKIKPIFRKFSVSPNTVGSTATNDIAKDKNPLSRLFRYTTGNYSASSENSYPAGPYNASANAQYNTDRLFYPQYSLYAKLKSRWQRAGHMRWILTKAFECTSAQVNSSSTYAFPTYSNPNSPNDTTIREELGNCDNNPEHPQVFAYLPRSSFVGRWYGGEVKLRDLDSDTDSEWFEYWPNYLPPDRKIVFDPYAITPFDLRVFNIVTWAYEPIEDDDYNNF